MPKDGTRTKEKILDKAQELILQNGFAGTSIDMLIGAVGITKGAFFYHFKSKADLAKALIQRFTEQDLAYCENLMARAEKISKDPLHQLQIFVGFFSEESPNQLNVQCLIASYSYESNQFDSEVMNICSQGLVDAKRVVVLKIQEILKTQSTLIPVDPESLADHFLAVYEGAIILARTWKNPKIIYIQLTHFQTYLELLFQPVDEED